VVLLTRLRVGLDGDGVVLDGAEAKSRASRILFGIDIPPRFAKRELLVREGIITSKQYDAIKDFAYKVREQALTFQFVPGAREHIDRMLRDGWFVPVISSRPEVAARHIVELFQLHGWDIPVLSNGMSKDKTAIVRDLGGLDVYVDDSIEALQCLVGVVPRLYLFDQPYNRDEDPGDIAVRVYSWQEFYSLLLP
jgi:hypothetical protein